MLGRNIFISIILFFVLFFFAVPKTYAVTPPTFPSCVNPQGQLKDSFSDGVHGIPGNSSTFTGSDSVYRLSNNDTLMQCFCAPDGSGIQTNWWKVSSLNDSEIQVLKNQGWIFIPDGSLWGLDSSPYLAKNIDFFCQGGGMGGGDVLGASTDPTKGVLGLANTGNIVFVFSVISAGFLMTALGIILGLKKGK